MINLTDKNELLNYLKSNGLWAKHSLGQNFLVNKEVLDQIVEAAELSRTDCVIEVGPGLGTLTQELLPKVDKLIAIEKDDNLAKLLETYVSKMAEDEEANSDGMPKPPFAKATEVAQLVRHDRNNDRLKIINGDILQVNIPELIGDRPYKVVANIPYYITSKILRLFLELPKQPETIVLLVQKEVAERICAKKGDMSTLAVSVQAYAQAEIVSIVPRNSFFPAPDVDSAILRIKVSSEGVERFFPLCQGYGGQVADAQNDKKDGQDDKLKELEKQLFRLVHIGFASRRKTLANNITSGYHLDKKIAADIIKSAGFSEGVRAQELDVQDWANLLNQINNTVMGK
jgi:16S rRNA (adenine1518-N6/adenine1519-N6)-dimethyltransferase